VEQGKHIGSWGWGAEHAARLPEAPGLRANCDYDADAGSSRESHNAARREHAHARRGRASVCREGDGDEQTWTRSAIGLYNMILLYMMR